MDVLSRRGFLSAAVTGTAGALVARAHASMAPYAEGPGLALSGFRGTLCLFSKLLPDLPAGELGRALAALGFGGVDLTVRPGGHVVPERAAVDLPPFLAAVREEGLEVPMITTGLLSAAGLVRYEISNWAKRPRSSTGERSIEEPAWSRHNLGYWTGGDYLGFGAGAHGHRNGRRSWNLSSPRTYIARSPAVEEGWEALPDAERAAEAAMVGLRLAGGLDRGRFAEVWGEDPVVRWRGELQEAVGLGLIELTDDAVALTERGFFLWGHVARSLLGAIREVSGT